MSNTSVDLFIHSSGRPQVIAAELNEILRDVLERHSVLPETEVFVFVGECEEARLNPHGDEDSHEPVDISLTVEMLELHKHHHVHIHSAKRVEVTVNYNGQHHRRSFSPATTIETVTKWAKDRFHIDPVGGADMVLQQSDGVAPRQDLHLCDLIKPGEHALVFTLAPEVTPQG